MLPLAFADPLLKPSCFEQSMRWVDECWEAFDI